MYLVTKNLHRKILMSLKFQKVTFNRKKHFSNYCVELLKGRSIIQITGDDVKEFLQGLVTNNMKCFNEGAVAMYTLFLNNRGRVLFDSIIYRCNKPDTFLLECDSSCISSLIKHLSLYKVRKKIQIGSLENQLNIWSVYNSQKIHHKFSEAFDEHINLNSNGDQRIDISKANENTIVIMDPRVSDLGFRVIAPKDEDIIRLFDGVEKSEYQVNRYKLGIAEGSDEIIKGNSFPLEMNADYLRGISFDKGCYIGQELTARTHHTGVVRKRLMPLVFESSVEGVPMHSPIEDAVTPRKSAVGKLMCHKSNYGLGLMRVKETLESKTFKVIDVLCRSFQPGWWPSEIIKQHYLKINK